MENPTYFVIDTVTLMLAAALAAAVALVDLHLI